MSELPRILVVDDNKQNLSLLERALTSAQYAVVTAEDGPTALKLIGSAAPDLVLLDVMMPGMSGYEVCQRIRANEATCLLPVVMLTALTQLRHAVRGSVEGIVIVLAHLDVMANSDGGWTNISRELVPLLYEAPGAVLLGFRDPTLPALPVVEKLFPKRYTLTPPYGESVPVNEGESEIVDTNTPPDPDKRRTDD